MTEACNEYVAFQRNGTEHGGGGDATVAKVLGRFVSLHCSLCTDDSYTSFAQEFEPPGRANVCNDRYHFYYPRESEGLCFYRRWFVCLFVYYHDN